MEAHDLEIVVYEMGEPIVNVPYRFKIGKPVWAFSTVKNPNRKWWQLWKPIRVVHPDWNDLYEYARAHHDS